MKHILYDSEWDPSDPVMCTALIQRILGKMDECHAPFLFCRFCREAYTIDRSQRDSLKREIHCFLRSHKNAVVQYADTDDAMVTAQLSKKEFEQKAALFFSYFSELILVLPGENADWQEFLNAFCCGRAAESIKTARAMAEEMIFIATDNPHRGTLFLLEASPAALAVGGHRLGSAGLFVAQCAGVHPGAKRGNFQRRGFWRVRCGHVAAVRVARFVRGSVRGRSSGRCTGAQPARRPPGSAPCCWG